MKKIIFSFLLFFSIAFSITGADVVLKASNVTTNYIHAKQDMYVYVNNAGNNVTVNIGDLVIITADSLGWGIVQGLEHIDTASVWYIAEQGFTIKYVITETSSFQQYNEEPSGTGKYTITVNASDGTSVEKQVYYNKEFVMKTVTINANSKYRHNNWWKAGLSNSKFSDANLAITGQIHYRYDEEVYPSQSVSVKLQMSNDTEVKSQTTVGSNGVFSFTNFAIPSEELAMLIISVDIDGGTLYASNSQINIKTDAAPPVLNSAKLLFVTADAFESEGTMIAPIAGYFNRTNVSFNLKDEPTDDGGSGISNNIWVVSPADSSTGFFTKKDEQFVVTFSYNGIALQGARNLVIHVFDNVYNYVTMNIRITVDTTAPNEFIVTVQPDINNEPYQLMPEIGWYNDQTVSFSWLAPFDAGGVLAYQFKSEGWNTWSALVDNDIVLNSSQSVREAWVTVDHGGQIPKHIWVRAIDRAGNIKTAYTTIKVDVVAPTVNLTLVPDTTGKENSLVNILPQVGWYNDLNVEWSCGAEDDGELREKAFAYRYLFGNNSNVATSDWQKIVGEKVVTPDSNITNNVFKLIVTDKAGNTSIATAQVFVDLEDPEPTNFRISFDPCTIKEGGVTPEAKWYNQTTLDLVVTWDTVVEDGVLDRVMLYVDHYSTPLISYISEDIGNITFNNISVVPNDRTPIDFQVLLVDKAGNYKEIHDQIYVDITKPNDFQLVLADDSDSFDDGLAPESGYYDDSGIDFMILLSQADFTAKNQPFQIKVNDNDWGEPTSNLYIANFMVEENTCNLVEVRYMDSAGNVLTNSFRVTVDTEPPAGSFDLHLVTCDYIPESQVTPDSGWYNKTLVSFNFIVPLGTQITDTFDIREYAYLLKIESDANFNQGHTSLQDATIFVANSGSLQRNIVGAIADKAGNLLKNNANVFVDTDIPQTNFEARVLPDSEPGENGIWPQLGWHAKPTVNINWDQANDGAGSLHSAPYRVRSDGTSAWSDFQFKLNYADIYVSPNNFTTQNIYIQVRDKAGNLATKNVPLKVDITAPVASVGVSPQAFLEGVTYDIFISSYNVTFPLSGWFNTENIIVTWQIVDEGRWPSKNARIKIATGEYGVTLDTNEDGFGEIKLAITANNHITSDVFVLVWDNAGNSNTSSVGIRVDTQAPEASILLRSSSNSSVMPFVHSTDVLFITMDFTEPISVTPFIRYRISQDSQEFVTIDNVQGVGDTWYCSVDIRFVLYDGLHDFRVIAIDDAGNILTTINGHTMFFKLGPEEVALPASFNVQDKFTGRSDLTNAGSVSISFIVGTSINAYKILEGDGANSRDVALKSSLLTLNDKPYENVAGNKKFNLDYEFVLESSEPKLGKNSLRTLHLWVQDDSGNYASEAVTASIIFDQTTPNIKIRPNKDNVSDQNVYDGVKLWKATYIAQLEITHNASFVGGEYQERALVTPEWKVSFYASDSQEIPITVSILSPYLPLELGADNEDSPNYKAIWWAKFDLFSILGDAVATYNAVFEVIVTDEARNTTNYISQGARFVVDTTIPNKPFFECYSLDNRNYYTNSLTINYILSKNIVSENYGYFYICDNYYGQPLRSQYQNSPWISDGQGSTVVSFDGQYKFTDESQGLKVVRAWVADKNLASCEQPAEWLITYDSEEPTYSIFINPIDILNSEQPVIITICFNEQIDLSANNKIWIEKKANNEIVSTSDLVLYGKVGQEFVYSVTVNRADVETREEAIALQVSINVFDFAGNNLRDRSPFARALTVLGYEDYFERAYTRGDQSYRTNSLEIGKKGIPILVAELKAEDRDVHVSGVNLQFNNMGENKIDRFYVYLDKDEDGLFNAENDLKLGEKVYAGSGSNLLISMNETIIEKLVTTTIFIVVDVYSGAITQSDSIGFGFATSNPFIVDYYESVAPPSSQSNSGIVATFNITKTLLNISYIPKPQDEATQITNNINAGTRVVVKKFALRSWLADTPGKDGVGVDGALWTGIRLRIKSPEGIHLFNPSLVTRVAIYKDNGAQVFVDNDDLLVSSGTDKFQTAQQQDITINFPYPVNIGGNDPEFYIVVDTDKTLQKDKQFSFEIASASWFEFRDGDFMIDSGEFPMKTITFNSDYYISKINIDTMKNTERYVYQEENINVLKFKMSVDYKAGAVYPKFYSIAVYEDSGTLKFNDVDVKLYKYHPYQASNDFSLGEQVPLESVQYLSNKVNLILVGGADAQTNPRVLVTENYFALVITPKYANNVGKEGVFRVKFINPETQAGNISFQDSSEKAYGKIVNELEVTTNVIEIVNKFQPFKPVITGNAYSSSHRSIRFFYSTTVNEANQGIDSLSVKIGTQLGSDDIFDRTISVNNIENSKNIQLATVDIVLTDSAKFLSDNTTYYISVKAGVVNVAEPYWSITGNFAFHTDFTPAWIENSNKLHVIAKWDEGRHDIAWTAFTELESQIQYYVVEMLSGQSLRWVQVATKNTTSYINTAVEVDTPYQYRVKAVNAAGLHSDYLDSGERIMTASSSEIIFNVSNYPNPFYSSFEATRIVFSLNQDIDATITIYDSLGHFVRRFDSKSITKEGVISGSGYFCYVDWDGRNESGQFVSKGGYFAVIEAAPYASGGKATKIVRMIGVIR